MLETRRRRLALLFALVLLMELALLCCASVHVASHVCRGHDCCAICATLRPEYRAALAALAVALGLALAALPSARPSRRAAAACGTPVSRRVRMND